MANGLRITFKKQNLISGAFASDGTTQDIVDISGSPDYYLANGFVYRWSTKVWIPNDVIFQMELRTDL